MADVALPHAVGVAVAVAFDASLFLLRVLEVGPEAGQPPEDSLDWQLSRAEADA